MSEDEEMEESLRRISELVSALPPDAVAVAIDLLRETMMRDGFQSATTPDGRMEYLYRPHSGGE